MIRIVRCGVVVPRWAMIVVQRHCLRGPTTTATTRLLLPPQQQRQSSSLRSYSNSCARRNPASSPSPSSIRGTRTINRTTASTTAASSTSTRGGQRQTTAHHHQYYDDDLKYAIATVRQYDPAGYLPGQLLPTAAQRASYYAVRSFWVESGLRHGSSTAAVPPNACPSDHLDWWQEGIHGVVFDNNDNVDNNLEETQRGSDSNDDDDDDDDDEHQFETHPTLRLLRSLRKTTAWDDALFDDILDSRRTDLSVKQYGTMDDLTQHAERSCGSLLKLVLLSSGESDAAAGLFNSANDAAMEAARMVGICHGLTNALRTSIPVMSTTGKLVVPTELTQRYGVRSPRYLLSALGQGDTGCVQAMQNAVRDICLEAQDRLERARALRPDILVWLQEQQQERRDPGGSATIDPRSVLGAYLPGLASETFLRRLRASDYNLTDRSLRQVAWSEHGACAARMIAAYYRRTY